MTAAASDKRLEILDAEFAGFLAACRHGVGNFLQHHVVRRGDTVEATQGHDFAVEEVGFDGSQTALQPLPDEPRLRTPAGNTA